MSLSTAQPRAAQAAESIRACIACGARRWRPLYRALACCGECGFVRADLDVSPAELERLYQSDYFQGEEYGDYLADAEVHRRNFARRYERLVEITGGFTSLYEIGCAYGFWLQHVSRQGVRAAGVDVCAEPVAYAAAELGQQAVCGDFLSQPIEPGAYQVFAMWDTIEHLAHPERFVARAVELLPSGGWFAATTGDIGSAVARRQGPRWRMIHPPTHLQYFSRATLTRLLARQGLDVVATESTPMYRSLSGTLSGLRRFGRWPLAQAATAAAWMIPTAWQQRLGFWLDLGDIMLVVARKP